MPIEQYRDVADARSMDRVTLDQSGQGAGKVQSGRGWFGKAINWLTRASSRDAGRGFANRTVKLDLHRALVKSAGADAADRAMREVLGSNWRQSDSSLEKRHVARILDKSHHIRQRVVSNNIRNADRFANTWAKVDENLQGLGETTRGGVIGPDGFVQGGAEGSAFHKLLQDEFGHLPRNAQRDAKLYDAFMTHVTRHPDYYTKALTDAQIKEIARRTTREFYASLGRGFDESHPAAARYLDTHSPNRPRTDQSLEDIAADVRDGQPPLGNDAKQTALAGLTQIRHAQTLLAAPSYDVSALADQHRELNELSRQIADTREQLDRLMDQLDPNDELDDDGDGIELDDNREPAPRARAKDLLSAVGQELAGLSDQLESKRQMLWQTRLDDPFSEHNVAHKKLMLARTARQAVETRLAEHEQELRTKLQDAPPDKKGQAEQALSAFQGKAGDLRKAMAHRVQEAEHLYLQADPSKHIDPKQLKQSPFYASEKDTREQVMGILAVHAGIVDKKDRFKANFEHAKSHVLNTRQDWDSIQRTIVTHRGGQTIQGRSTIDPAVQLNGSYTQQQLDEADLQGISAHTKVDSDDDSDAAQRMRRIPKNLQHSKLEVNGQTKVDMIRHGVVANEDQAKSVISTAMWSDPALRGAINQRIANGDDTPIDYAFSNVNLMTPRPSPKPWKKSKRRRLQDEHFAAFNGLADRRQPVTIPFVDEHGNTHDIKVNLKLSTIGVPVNGWSGRIGRIGVGGHASSVWGHLASTNEQGLRNLIGDVGNPSNGIAGSARGTRVGGMIGDVMKRLDEEISAGGAPRRLADLKRLRADLQESADIVRDLYCAGDHKRSDGDRYKLAMAVLFADSLAKQAHTLLGDSARGSGFGASQGCMSNKDRGGNADGYLKALHLASKDAFKLLRHSSGSLNPHELVSMISELPPEDAKNLLVLGLLSSGQQEAQQIQTMVMGSKNAKDLMAAITADPVALEMLAGLGKDAKA